MHASTVALNVLDPNSLLQSFGLAAVLIIMFEVRGTTEEDSSFASTSLRLRALEFPDMSSSGMASRGSWVTPVRRNQSATFRTKA